MRRLQLHHQDFRLKDYVEEGGEMMLTPAGVPGGGEDDPEDDTGPAEVGGDVVCHNHRDNLEYNADPLETTKRKWTFAVIGLNGTSEKRYKI